MMLSGAKHVMPSSWHHQTSLFACQRAAGYSWTPQTPCTPQRAARPRLWLSSFFFALAQTKLPSALTGIMNALTPFFTIIISVLFFNVKPDKRVYFGVMLGFLGTLFLISTRENGQFSFNYRTVGPLQRVVDGKDLRERTQHGRHHPLR